MRISTRDKELGQLFRQLSHKFNNRYTRQASIALIRILFYYLANRNEQYLRLLFPEGPPSLESDPWRLTDSQGATGGSEYSKAARGRRCGHIFRSGEATYSCRTCTADDTCVLCTRCFEASDHEGHQVYVSMAGGGSGCCDCEDPEAWIRPVICSIHSPLPEDGATSQHPTQQTSMLPTDLQASIRATISRAFDFLVDVLSCCPEEMRTPKAESTIRQDEEKSRLLEKYYGLDQEEGEFALVLWNDEKHTMEEVADKVSRACHKPKAFGEAKAMQVDEVGRSVIAYNRNVSELLRQAEELSQIKVTVTIRSSRDLFREEMCATIIEWFSDIAGCSVGEDHNILMKTVCEEMLQPWRIGSEAFNLAIARHGIVDHQKTDERLAELRRQEFQAQQAARLLRLRAQRAGIIQRVERTQNAAPNNAEPVAAEGGADDDGANDGDDDDDGDQDVIAIVEEEEGDEDEDMDVDDEFDVDRVDAEDRAGDNEIPAILLEAVEAMGIPPASLNLRAQTRSPEGQRGDTPEPLPDYDSTRLFSAIPQTPGQAHSHPAAQPPAHWTEHRGASMTTGNNSTSPPYEDLNRRIRIDHLILYDLRMWKELRTNLKHLYISTVVAVPEFKRILSLRFAALYTHLSQLYLVADREYEQSIINLSLQMLTTPSITAEVVSRGNFLMRLTAILYTFLTKRQVGDPEDVDLTATISFDSGVLTNRRVYHFFNDMKYLLDSPYVTEQIRVEPKYLLQFLDFVKLYQGICPNVRAVGEHIEYESDAWINASVLVRDVTRLSRQFCEAFKWTKLEDPTDICRAIRQTAKIVIINSLGVEHDRFTQAEMKELTRFKLVQPYLFEITSDRSAEAFTPHCIIDFAVDKGSMSFHHALHYNLSWLIDSGKSMSRDQLQGLLTFTSQQIYSQELGTIFEVPQYSPLEYLLALFDIPLRVCVWLAQMRAGMWVRNGITLRHQMGTYRGVGQREVSHQRDLFLLQAAFAICPPATMLASVIDRFNMSDWVKGDFRIGEAFEDHQQVDVAEDFLHFLIIILSDRTLLSPPEEESTPLLSIAKRDIINILCFKPLTYSELTQRLSDKVQEMEEFHSILDEVAHYRPPEGLSDSGQIQLKDTYCKHIDPYNAYYSRGQREEAETMYRTQTAKETGKPKDEVFYVPQLQQIRSGIFAVYAKFSQVPLFSQIIFCFLRFVISAEMRTPGVSVGRIEGLLHTLLHLVLIAVMEDEREDARNSIDVKHSFIDSLLFAEVELDIPGAVTILWQLFMLLQDNTFNTSRPRVRFLLNFIRNKRPQAFDQAMSRSGVASEWEQLLGASSSLVNDDVADKKKQALERQARVMQAFKKQQNDFMENQAMNWGVDEEEDSDDNMEIEDHRAEQTWAFPDGTCIFCQEETKEQQLYGTLAYITETNILRQTDLGSFAYVQEVCSVPENLDHSAEDIRPFGVAGSNFEMLSKADASGERFMVERRGLGGGFPTQYQRKGPLITSCGHIMHYSCFQTYDNATVRRHSYQVHRFPPEDIKLKEFVCPLCKALGNSFLPVIWKPKPLTALRIPEGDSFGEWLATTVPNIGNPVFEPGLTPMEYSAMQYIGSTFVGSLGAALNAPSRMPSEIHLEGPLNTRSGFRIPAFLRFDHNEPPPEQIQAETPPRPLFVSELEKAYARLLTTIKLNNLMPSLHAMDDNETEVLAKALAFSVSAAEINQRGVEASAVGNYVTSLPELMLTHLRVLSETVSSCVALNNVRSRSRGLPSSLQIARQQAHQLFGSPTGSDSHASVGTPSLFSQDISVFLVECTAFLIPSFELEFHHILRLCYIAEITKVVVAVLDKPEGTWDCSQLLKYDEAYMNSDELGIPRQQRFSSWIEELFIHVREVMSDGDRTHPLWHEANPNTRYLFERILYRMLSKYALIFLRKAALLAAVRCGTDFSTTTTEMEVPELARLSQQLGLPTVDEVIESFLNNSESADILRRRALAWITAWAVQRKNPVDSTDNYRLCLTHPGIFELVSLPHAHDTLNAEAIRRRCPTTGNELSDPAICLFCGMFVCTQSRCCLKDNPVTRRKEGGCLRHTRECGGNIGMFFIIRKCAVICFHRDRGSFFTAPYLDRHGETDMGLRRKNQLFLNQKRYDRLFRDMWLRHEVPSAVARKLEAEINTGGWETI